MDGKKKLEELVALVGRPDEDGFPRHRVSVADYTIRSISDAYKAMEAENERLKSHLITKDENDG